MYGLEILRNDATDVEEYYTFQSLDITANEVNSPWKLPRLIFRDLKNQVRQWEICFDGENLITHHGVSGGVIQEVKRSVSVNNSGRNIYQQALIEGKKRYQDKIHEGYHTEGVDTIFKKPMMAEQFDKHIDKITGDFTLTYQLKIDGERALTSISSMGITRLSRSNKPIPFQDHLDNECYNLLSLLPYGTVLDGELYKHGIPFEEISSRCSVGRKEPHYDREIIEYWIFDIITPEPMDYINRYNLMLEAYSKCNLTKLVLLPLYTCEGNMESIEQHLTYAMSLGYEGIMIKNPNSKYIHGRTCNLLKVKKFIDEEAVIVDVVSGSGTEQDCAIFVLYDNVTGRDFPVRPQGTFEQRRYWYSNPNVVLGRYYTYKYFGQRTAGQLPRFPIGMRFRDSI